MDYHLDLNIMSVKLTIIRHMVMILLITGTDFEDQSDPFWPGRPPLVQSELTLPEITRSAQKDPILLK